MAKLSMTATESRPLRVVQISDMHLQSQPGGRLWGIDVDAGLAAVLRCLRQRHWPVDLLLATGDLVQDEGAAAYTRLLSFLLPLRVPVYCLPGNHDVAPALSQVLASGLVCRKQQVIVRNWQFVLLDTSLSNSAVGHLAASELTFLEQALSAHPNLHTIVCLHHHPIPVGSAWLDTMVVNNSDALFAVVACHPQVRAILCGHIHHDFATRHRGVALLGAPSTCVQFKPGQTTPIVDNIAPGYRWLELYEDGQFRTGVERSDGIV